MDDDSLLKLIARLVAFKTSHNNPAEFTKAVKFIKVYYAKLPGVAVRELKLTSPSAKLGANKPILLIHFKGEANPKILMSGHFDVIAAENRLFKLRKSGGKIFGRGVMDMKGGVAVLMEIMKHFAFSKIRPSLGLLLTADEEIGGPSAKTVVAKTKLRPKVVLLPDAGYGFSPSEECKGPIWVKVTAKGRLAHGSRPWEGDNAAAKLHRFFDKVSKHVVWINHGKKWGATINLSRIESGSTINQVPAEGSMYFDIRYPVTMKGAFFMKILRKELLPGMKLSVVDHSEPIKIDLDNPSIKKFASVFRKTMRRPVRWYKETGATDGRWFAYKGVPVIMVAGRGGAIHTEKEWANFNDLLKLKKLFIEYIESPG